MFVFMLFVHLLCIFMCINAALCVNKWMMIIIIIVIIITAFVLF